MNRILAAVALAVACLDAGATGDDRATKAAIGQAMSEGRMADAYRISLPLAEAGDPDMEFSMALFLESGQDLGVKLAPGEADSLKRRWLGRAALHRQRDAMKWLSQAFAKGELGLSRNDAASTCWADARAARIEPGACAAWLAAGK